MSDTRTLSALEELELRAGASDVDRTAWLAERRTGVTATEAKVLALVADGKLAASERRKLIDEKLGVVDQPFIGNAYTRWGNEREPVIAGVVEATDGIRPESRVFHAVDNPRFLASPDGVGVDWDDELLVSEIKTSGNDKRPGSEHFEQAGYRYQMVWAMRVTGARRCRYAHEFRLGDPMYGFEPGQLSLHWIEYDEEIAARLELLALAFLKDVDEARAARDAGEGPGIDEHADTLAVNYLRGLDEEKRGAEAKKGAYEELRSYLAAGEPFSQKSTLAQVTYSPEVVETVLVADEEAARAADPLDRWGDLVHAEAELKAARDRWAAHCEGFLTREEARVVKRETLRVTPARETRKAKP